MFVSVQFSARLCLGAVEFLCKAIGYKLLRAKRHLVIFPFSRRDFSTSLTSRAMLLGVGCYAVADDGSINVPVGQYARARVPHHISYN